MRRDCEPQVPPALHTYLQEINGYEAGLCLYTRIVMILSNTQINRYEAGLRPTAATHICTHAFKTSMDMRRDYVYTHAF
jgi:hypothetical protein